LTEWSALLGERPLLADGPVEEWLRQRGLPVPPPGAALGEVPPERLNLARPDLVSAGHRAFLRAGARLHRTNTLRANSIDLNAQGLAVPELVGRAEAVNNSAAAALRQAVGTTAICAGRIGPVAQPEASAAERQRAYAEQAIYLSDTGSELLILEGFPSAEEAVLALRAAGDAHGAPALVLIAANTGSPGGIEALGRALLEAGAEGLGAIGPEVALGRWAPALRRLGVPWAVFRDAPPEEPPEDFAQALAQWAERGAAIVGGGAGVLPAHIQAAARQLGKNPDG